MLEKVDAGLPSGWEVRHSNSKNLPYYFNESQKISRWEPPPGTDTERLKTYMAEHHSAPEIGPGAGTNGRNGNEGKIRARHLLIKHKDSRRPSSWREVSLIIFRVESSNVFHAG
jgi:NIMA-interacting peptidyl-prolyl cis-trans isomerase 1